MTSTKIKNNITNLTNVFVFAINFAISQLNRYISPQKIKASLLSASRKANIMTAPQAQICN